MTDFESLLSSLAKDLNAHGARWAVVGGHSISVRCEPRFTRDLDVAVAVDGDAEAEALVRGLALLGYGVQAIVEQTATKRLATVRLTPPGSPEGPMLDLLFASSGIEPEVVSEAELLEIFPGVLAPIASLPHLVALKILSRDDVHRPQDRLDLHALLTVAAASDIASARDAIRLITQRGAHRGRDLEAALQAAIEEMGSR